MALARGRLLSLDSYYESLRGNGGSSAAAEPMEVDSSSVSYFGLITQNKAVEGDDVRDVDHHPVAAESALNYPLVNNPPPAVSDPSSSSSGSGGFVFGMMNSPSPVTIDSAGVGGVGEHPHSNILNFKTGTGGGGATGCNYPSYLTSSMLSFDRQSQMEDYTVGFTDGLEQLDHFNFKYGGDGHHSSMRLANDQNFLQTSSGNINGSTSVAGMTKDNGRIGSDEQFGWIYASDTHTTDGDGHQESELLDADVRKRPHQMAAGGGGGGGGNGKASSKKHCSGGVVSKKTKNKAAATKDPQSIAAKNRRERISEKLKILQELVPNGTKVDMVTMLEKAISYVKFLQLQVKVLATDEFWPTQGGKAPEVSQVKEAIDAILSSHSISTSK